jgi:ribosomal protein S18 acetylase RimI-like enzyme
VLYRLYSAQDFTSLYAIEELCFQPPFRFSRQYLRQLVSRSNTTTWVAEQGGQMCGFAIVENLQEPGSLIGYIQTIEVVPGCRGQGVGGELLLRVEDSARAAGALSLRLHVDEKNSSAIKLYAARGYLRQGREEDYYAPDHAALIYEKPLRSDAENESGKESART